jgi:hypothetical protein
MARGLKKGQTNNIKGRPPGIKETIARDWHNKMTEDMILKSGGIVAFSEKMVARMDDDVRGPTAADFILSSYKEKVKAELGKAGTQGTILNLIFSKPINKREKNDDK